MLIILPLKGPVHLLSVLALDKDSFVQVQDCRLDSHLRIDRKGEYGLVLPIDSDVGRDVMSEGQPRGQLPHWRIFLKVKDLGAAILAATKHQQMWAILVEEACSRPHRVITELGER